MQQPIFRATLAADPLDLPASMAMQLLGQSDPTGVQRRDSFLKAHVDPAGRPATWRFTRTGSGLLVELQADQPAALHSLAARFPPEDGAASFQPAHPVLARLSRLRGLRLVPLPWPWDVAAGAVLQQRVRWRDAFSDFRRISLRWGVRVGALTTFPGAPRLAEVPPYHLEAMGIDGKRARALIGLARAEAIHGFLQPGTPLDVVRARMLSLPGIGPWTAGLVLGFAFGDPDAVPVGDLHIPTIVCQALAGEAEGTDERMLELLEPVRGHRFRAIRLILWTSRWSSGGARARAAV